MRLLASIVLLLALAAPASGATHPPYPPSVKRAFVHGCVKGGASRAVCQCTIHATERRYSFPRFERLLERYTRSHRLPRELARLATGCARRVG